MSVKVIFERLKSPIVWLGLGATFIMASGINPENMTSWGILIENIVAWFSNPYLFGSTVIAWYAYLNNPTNKDGF